MPFALAQKVHVPMLSAVLALIVPTVQSSDNCNQSSPFGLLAGYSPGGDVNEHSKIDLDIQDMIAAPDLVAAKLMYTAGGNSKVSGGRTRTVRGFSTGAKRRSTSSEISNLASTRHAQARAKEPFELLANPHRVSSVQFCAP